ncbi:MAG: hypothetical protein AAF570_18205 [Bacteroidota bacterium]
MKNSSSRLVVFVAIGLAVIGFLAYQFYFAEKWAYSEAMAETEHYLAEGYLYSYPDGRYKEEVQKHVDDLHWKDVQEKVARKQESDSPAYQMVSLIERYLEERNYSSHK